MKIARKLASLTGLSCLLVRRLRRSQTSPFHHPVRSSDPTPHMIWQRLLPPDLPTSHLSHTSCPVTLPLYPCSPLKLEFSVFWIHCTTIFELQIYVWGAPRLWASLSSRCSSSRNEIRKSNMRVRDAKMALENRRVAARTVPFAFASCCVLSCPCFPAIAMIFVRVGTSCPALIVPYKYG